MERKVKPIKRMILTKTRNKAADRKAEMLFRTSQNLRQLMKIKMDFKRKNMPLPSCAVQKDFVNTETMLGKGMEMQSVKDSDSSNSNDEFQLDL